MNAVDLHTLRSESFEGRPATGTTVPQPLELPRGRWRVRVSGAPANIFAGQEGKTNDLGWPLSPDSDDLVIESEREGFGIRVAAMTGAGGFVHAVLEVAP